MNSKLERKQTNKPFINFISGLLGSFLSVTSCHPLEIARTRLNLQQSTKSANKYDGFLDALRKIYKDEGLLGYYKGYRATVISVPTFYSLFFGIYNQIKSYLSEQRGVTGYKNHLLSSISTGAICDLITNPLWVDLQEFFKYKQQSSQERECRHNIYMIQEGFFALYKGLGASFLGLTHVGVQFPVYEQLKLVMQERRGFNIKPTSGDILVASILSKLCACLITYPHVVLRTRLHDNRQNYSVGALQPKIRIIGLAKTIFKNEGLGGFYRGLAADVIRVLPMNAITFVVYEKCSQYLEERF